MCGSPAGTHKILGKRLNRSQGKNPRNKIGITTTVVKCIECQLIYPNPLPMPFNIQDHYGISPEKYWPEGFLQPDENYFKVQIQTIRHLLTPTVHPRALDIGAGIGGCMQALAKAGFDTYGFEPSEPFYRFATEKMKIDPGKLKLGMIEDMSYPSDFFDFISFSAVLEHLYDPSSSLIKAMEWLKPGGIMYVEVPSSDWLINKIINAYYFLICTDYTGNISPMHAPFHLYEFGLQSFIRHAKTNNYEVALCEYAVCNTYLPKIFDYVLKPVMKWTKTGMQLCIWLRKNNQE